MIIFFKTRGHASDPLKWRHNERDGISNHQPHDCLLNGLLRRWSKKTSKLRVTGFCAGNSPVTGECPGQRASIAENVSIWCRHDALQRDATPCQCEFVIFFVLCDQNTPCPHMPPIVSNNGSNWVIWIEFNLVMGNNIYCSVWMILLKLSQTSMGLLPDTWNCRLRMRRECRERFPRYGFQRKSLVNDPGMHHGRAWRTCRDACRDR